MYDLMFGALLFLAFIYFGALVRDIVRWFADLGDDDLCVTPETCERLRLSRTRISDRGWRRVD